MNIINKKARFEYSLEKERYEAGIVLTGSDTKAVKTGHGDLSNAQIRIINNELWLINANIPFPYLSSHNPTRSRKLLLNKKEIEDLIIKSKQKKLAFVPVKLYNKGPFVKLEIALGKSKRKFEKRESIKKKDVQRELERESKYQGTTGIDGKAL